MGVYIKGMEMPKRGHTITITIVGSGQAYVEYFDCRPHVEETIEYAAVPVPPHGDLIDYDFCMKNYELLHDDDGNPVYAVRMRDINNAPTIIPAEPITAEEEKNDK